MTASNKIYDVGINAGKNQVHVACFTEGAGGHVFVSKSEVRDAEGDHGFECPQYHIGGDVFPPSSGGADARGWGCWRCDLFHEVYDAAKEGLFRA